MIGTKRALLGLAALVLGIVGGYLAYEPQPAAGMPIECWGNCPCVRCGANGSYECYGAMRGGYS